MKITLNTIEKELTILEKQIDDYHRQLVSGKKSNITENEFILKTITIGYNLQEIDNGKHITMHDNLFRRLMIAAKLIDNMQH